MEQNTAFFFPFLAVYFSLYSILGNMTNQADSLSIILPIFNERERIVLGVQKALELAEQWPSETEIILVDDGSNDGGIEQLSAPVLERITVLYIEHQGKGAAVQAGVLAARMQRILFSDIDWSVPIEQILSMLLLEDKLIIASREIKGARRIAEPPWRHVLGKIFNRWVQWMLLSGYEDTQCGCKIFDGDLAHRIFSQVKEKGWAFDVEVLLLAHLYGIHVREVPVSWQYQTHSKITLVQDGIAMAQAVLRIKKRLLQGEYRF